MDQQPNIPNILPNLNREKQKKEERRSGWAGLLSRLGFGSRGAGGAVGGVGGAGGAGGGALGALGSLGIGGGILATKAGIIGLILVATTVAGSIGVVGYKLFGPSAADRTGADFSSLFASKPQGADEAGPGGASGNGVSKSLDYLVQANTGEPPAPADQTAAEPAAPPEASASVTPPPLVNNNAPSQGAAARLKSDRKFGELTARAASGSGGTASMPAAGAGAGLGSGVKSSLASMSKAPSVKAGRSANALRSGVRRLGAYRQATQVGRDQHGAPSSAAAGRTYDNGAARSASPQSPEGTLGPTSSSPDSNTPTNPSNSSSPEQRYVEPPATTGTNVTPWQAAINTSLLLVMLSAGLLYAATKIQGMAGLSAAAAKGWIMALAGLAALAALAVVGFGSMIGGGQYGQPLQGQLLAVAGGCLLATAAILIVSVAGAGSGTQVQPGQPNPSSPGNFYDQAGADKANAAASEAALSSAMGGSTQMLMMCCGGAALAAAAWAYMAPAKQYDGSLFKDGRPPDWDNPYQSSQVVRPPSQGILDQYLA